MTSIHIRQCHNVEKKRLHIVVQSLVVQKELRQEAEMLTVLLITLPIHLPHLELALPVDLITWRMPPNAFLGVPFDARLGFLIAQAELADIHLGEAGGVIRIGRLVPYLHLVLAHADVPKGLA